MDALALFDQHLERFTKQFSSIGKAPRDKDWRPVRHAIRDVILFKVVARLQEKDNVMEVDVFLTYDPDAISGWSGTKFATIYILSQAYKSGSSMGFRFAKNVEGGSVPAAIVLMAEEYRVFLKQEHIDLGVITPKEARLLYLALTEFSPEAAQRAMELSLADKVSPERVCYMVHHLTYTKEEMESLLLGAEFPENILLGKITPEEYLLYQDVVLRTRDIVLGGILDRTLKLKEIIGEDGKVTDLEETERYISIGFDPRYFAKIYETREETPIPWTVNRNLVVQAGERIVVMVRARDWADFVYYIKTDAHALQSLKQAYADKPTHFFLLVPRNVLEISEQELERYRKALLQIGVTLMICPESVALLDTEVMRRLRECETMRHDVGSGEEREQIKAVISKLDFNSTEIRLVAVPRNLQIGRLLLSQLTEQAVYDEYELRRGVNKHNVRARYHLVCDRIQFLAHQALASGQYESIVLDQFTLSVLANLWIQSPEKARSTRLLPMFWMPQHENLLKLQFLEQAQQQGQVVIAVQNKHAQQTQSVGQTVVPVEQLTRAFIGQFVPDWINDYGNLPFDEIVVKHLWRAVSSSRRGQANGVNLSEVPHMIATKALRQMVYERPPKDVTHEIAVNIVYTDGSQARPFQLFVLKPRNDIDMQQLRSQPPIRMGMISMRHPEMDSMVHQYWFRNIEVSQPGMTSAEVDELCYQITRRKLGDIYRLNKPVRFEFYQTGFQAPLIGFWRAIVEFLKQGQGKPPMLEIDPCFYIGTKRDSEEMLNAIRTGRRPRVNYEQLYVRGLPWV
ncbi:MAG: hypothetical protein HY044_01995 [Candidatus Woesebacteria bacterium]|nr:MAG: hypothetical protein HY044_01995 [Candidatus Woesebacteria bacterium]